MIITDFRLSRNPHFAHAPEVPLRQLKRPPQERLQGAPERKGPPQKRFQGGPELKRPPQERLYRGSGTQRPSAGAPFEGFQGTLSRGKRPLAQLNNLPSPPQRGGVGGGASIKPLRQAKRNASLPLINIPILPAGALRAPRNPRHRIPIQIDHTKHRLYVTYHQTINKPPPNLLDNVTELT